MPDHCEQDKEMEQFAKFMEAKGISVLRKNCLKCGKHRIITTAGGWCESCASEKIKEINQARHENIF